MGSRNNHGTLAEMRFAKAAKARPTPASGALPGAKGDCELRASHTEYEFRIECKSTVRRSFSVQEEHLKKISREAVAMGQQPALAFMFVDDEGRPRRYGEWVAIPAWMFREFFSPQD